MILKRHAARVIDGPAPPLVFSHGYGCDQEMWRRVTPDFKGRSEIILFDHLGSGKSDLSAFDPQRHSRLEGYATDVIALLDRLARGPVVFVGHSVSSMIGVLAAAERPDLFKALVLIGPSPCYLHEGDYPGGFGRADIDGLLDLLDHNPIGWAAQMAPVIMENPDQPDLAGELEQSFCRTDPAAARVFARATFLADNRADLARCPVPALVLQTDPDAIAPPAVGRYVASHLPRGHFQMLAARGHCPHVSAPGQVSRAILDFLAQLPGGT